VKKEKPTPPPVVTLKQRMKTTTEPKELQQAFIDMICTNSIYKQLDCSKAYPAVIRADMRRGIFPKVGTMRELLTRAGWVKKTDEKWVQKSKYDEQ